LHGKRPLIEAGAALRPFGPRTRMPNLYPLVLAITVLLDLRNGDCFQRFVQFVSP
jgi:hypothetical protein